MALRIPTPVSLKAGGLSTAPRSFAMLCVVVVVVVVASGCGLTPGDPTTFVSASEVAAPASATGTANPASTSEAAASASASPAPTTSSPSEALDLESVLPDHVAGYPLDYEFLVRDQYRTSYLITSAVRETIEALATDPDDVPIAVTWADPDRPVSIGAYAFGHRVPDGEIRQAMMDLFVPETPWTDAQVGGKEVATVSTVDGTGYLYVSEGVAYLVLADDPAVAEALFRLLPP